MANTLEGHRTGILNWYDFSISTGPLEGINNKIGALQRTACGYRDRDYFVAKLYALHLAKFELIGQSRFLMRALHLSMNHIHAGT